MGSTFKAIDLRVEAWPENDYKKFVAHLRQAVGDVLKERSEWYRDLQRKYRWVNWLRHLMVLAGALAALATAAATVARVFVDKTPATYWGQPADAWLLIAAVVLYAVMAAMAFYERMEEGTGHYFRSAMAVLQIRDAWTAYQFKDAILSLEPEPAAADLPALKRRWLEEAQAFVKLLDTQATTELGQWQDAFKAAIGQLSNEATTGLKTGQAELDKVVKERVAKAEKDAQEAKEAADKAIQAAKPAILNVKIDDTSGAEATVKVDGAIVARDTRRTFAIPNLPQGLHIVRVEVVSGSTTKAAEVAKEFAAGVVEVPLKPV